MSPPKVESEEFTVNIPERCLSCSWGESSELEEGMSMFRCRKKRIPNVGCEQYKRRKEE